MTADNRSVATDALATLGTIISENEKRDAIHLAVIPAKASETLRPGQSVNAENGLAVPAGDGVGIVDPFLPRNVQAGEMFWLILRPRTIQSLRHVWSHPAFPDEPIQGQVVDHLLLRKAASEQWLRDFAADGNHPGYEALVAAAVSDYNDDDEYLHFGEDASGEIPPEFWTHIEIVTGKQIKNRPTYFSCSC